MSDDRSFYNRGSFQHAPSDPPKNVRDEHSDTRGLLSPDPSPYMMSSQPTTYQPYAGNSPYSPPYEQYGQEHYVSNKSSPAFPQEDHSANCNARDGYRTRYSKWELVSIILLSVYSTALSGAWVGLAIAGPFYNFVGNGLSPTVASTLVAAFAKSIELSFVTVFVAFLGQYLSRKALSAASEGITLADMQLRSFLLQPGLIIGGWHYFNYTARTALGLLTIIGAFNALLYTTASDALVSPKPSLRDPKIHRWQSVLGSDFANATWLQNSCPTPLDEDMDIDARGSTCSGVELSGQTYNNYMQYLSSWRDFNQGIIQLPVGERPKPVGMLYDNTTAQGDWVYNTGADILRRDSASGGRLINNVTMVMPHSGIYRATMTNFARQANTSSDSSARINVDARVVSPAINVVCVAVSAEEMAPLIFARWPMLQNRTESEISSIMPDFMDNFPGYRDRYLETDEENAWRRELEIPSDWANRTVMDDIFGFGAADSNTPPPVFGILPATLQSVYNTSVRYGPDHAYVLVAANSTEERNYMLCSMSMSTEQHCSTQLAISVQGGQMRTNCEPGNEMAYTSSAPPRFGLRDWGQVAHSWGTSVALGHGISNGQSVNARLLSQLIPSSEELDNTQPTVAEGLAVQASCTILTGSQSAPMNQDHLISFIGAQAGENPQPDFQQYIGTMQTFESNVQISGYMSGATLGWQKAFNVILVSVFLMNCFCLIYFIHAIRIGGLVNDFVEPQNMFSLALHSPADRRLAGTSATGPERHHMRERWFIKEDYNHQLFIGDGRRRRGHTSWMSHAPASGNAYYRVQEMEVDRQEAKAQRSAGKERFRKSMGLNILMGGINKGQGNGGETKYQGI